MGWSGGLAEWQEGSTVFISVAFSWRAYDAYQRAVWHDEQGRFVRVGGPGLFARSIRDMFADVAHVGDVGFENDPVNALPHHNPDATIASRGCPVGCHFCIVPKVEGLTFTLIPDFMPRPILCDNNLSALPVEYQQHIIDKYMAHDMAIQDANSGFEPRTFDEGTYRRWRDILKGPWRFAYDETREEEDVYRMVRILRDVPASRKRVYVLIGNEPFEECYRRITQVIDWGCEPHVQPMIALNALVKRPMVKYDWTEQRLRDLARWANRWVWRKTPFAEYERSWNAGATVAESQMRLVGVE